LFTAMSPGQPRLTDLMSSMRSVGQGYPGECYMNIKECYTAERVGGNPIVSSQNPFRLAPPVRQCEEPYSRCSLVDGQPGVCAGGMFGLLKSVGKTVQRPVGNYTQCDFTVR